MSPFRYIPFQRSDPPLGQPHWFNRCIVAIDPPFRQGGDVGIVVLGRRDYKVHVLADLSLDRPTGSEWPRLVREAVATFLVDTVVSEEAGGSHGEFVRALLASCGVPVRVDLYRNRSSSVRDRLLSAAGAYDAGYVLHAGDTLALEHDLRIQRRHSSRVDALLLGLDVLSGPIYAGGEPRLKTA